MVAIERVQTEIVHSVTPQGIEQFDPKVHSQLLMVILMAIAATNNDHSCHMANGN